MTSVQVTHHYPSVTPETLFDAFLTPEKVGQWMFGKAIRENEEVLHIEIEPRVGGQFSFLVNRLGNDIDHVGTYLEIDRPRLLVFTWGVAPVEGEPSKVTIQFSPWGSVTLTQELPAGWEDYVTRCRDAWDKMLKSLETALVAR